MPSQRKPKGPATAEVITDHFNPHQGTLHKSSSTICGNHSAETTWFIVKHCTHFITAASPPPPPHREAKHWLVPVSSSWVVVPTRMRHDLDPGYMDHGRVTRGNVVVTVRWTPSMTVENTQNTQEFTVFMGSKHSSCNCTTIKHGLFSKSLAHKRNTSILMSRVVYNYIV